MKLLFLIGGRGFNKNMIIKYLVYFYFIKKKCGLNLFLILCVNG